MRLERHGGKWLKTKCAFWVEYPFNIRQKINTNKMEQSDATHKVYLNIIQQ